MLVQDPAFLFTVIPGSFCNSYVLPATLETTAFCCPSPFCLSALHSFARFLLDGTQQKSETLRPHRVRTSRQKLSASTVTSCFFAFNKPLNYIHPAYGMQAFFEMFFAYFWRSKIAESLEISGFLIAHPQHGVPRLPNLNR